MGMYLRRFTIRLMIPIVWNISKRRAAKALQTFSATEADSGWQFLYALDAMEDPKLRASLFHNAMEEMYHSAEFEKLSSLFSDEMTTKPKPERKPLYDRTKPLASFLAYVYVGEKDVYDQFDAYSAAVKKAAAVEGLKHTIFDEAKEDEDGHLKLARQALIEEYGSKARAEREVVKIRLKRAYDSWLRFSKRLGEFSSSLLISAIYFTGGLLFSFPCRKRFSNRFAEAGATPSVDPAVVQSVSDYSIQKSGLRR
jgi:rubrerythrin